MKYQRQTERERERENERKNKYVFKIKKLNTKYKILKKKYKIYIIDNNSSECMATSRCNIICCKLYDV